MFNDFKAYLSGSAPLEVCKSGEPTGTESQLAVIAVLLQIVTVDNRIGNGELETLFASLCRELDIAESAVSELFEITEFLLKEDSTRLQKYVELVAEKFSPSQKIRVVGLAWKIAMADGVLSTNESELIVLLRRDLGLTMEQALHAQQQAKAGAFDSKSETAKEE